LKKKDFLKIGPNIASFCKTLKGHNLNTVGPFELKIFKIPKIAYAIFQLDYDYLGHEMPRSEVGFTKFKLLPPPYPLQGVHGHPLPYAHVQDRAKAPRQSCLKSTKQ
jgi:hypothetical protein